MRVFLPLTRILACGAILLIPGLAVAAPPEPATVTFRLNDEIFPPEVDEVVTISINRVPIGTMTLGPRKVRDSFAATVSAAATYHYDLCGHASVRDRDGTIRMVKFDNAGTLDHLDGRSLGFFIGEDFTTTYLRDMAADGQAEAVPTITAGHSCSEKVANAAE